MRFELEVEKFLASIRARGFCNDIRAAPYTLVAELTYRCPLRCVYCSNPVDFALTRDELSTDEWRRAFSEAAKLGVVQLHLSGGEPMLRDDLVELIQHARACDLYTNLITGGTLLDEAKLHRFREAGLEHIQLSIQGAASASAEMVAGVRSHEKKLAVARLISKLGFPFTLNVVIHRLNIAEVPDLIRLAADLGAQRLELANTQFYAWGAENRRALMPTREQYLRAEEIALDAIPKYRGTLEIVFVQNDYLSGEPKPCMGGWGRSYICINPAGEVLPCHAAKVIPGLSSNRYAMVRSRKSGGSRRALTHSAATIGCSSRAGVAHAKISTSADADARPSCSPVMRLRRIRSAVSRRTIRWSSRRKKKSPMTPNSCTATPKTAAA